MNIFLYLTHKWLISIGIKYEKHAEMRFLSTYSEDFPRALNFNDWLKIYFNNYDEFKESNHQEIWEYRNKNLIS